MRTFTGWDSFEIISYVDLPKFHSLKNTKKSIYINEWKSEGVKIKSFAVSIIT